jgi:hypothetical protein
MYLAYIPASQSRTCLGEALVVDAYYILLAVFLRELSLPTELFWSKMPNILIILEITAVIS